MSTGFGSDKRTTVMVSVAVAACAIGGLGYLKFQQNQTGLGPYQINQIIKHANRTSVVRDAVGRPVVLGGFIDSSPSFEGQKWSFDINGPGGSEGQTAKLHAFGQLVEGKWVQDHAYMELQDGVCVVIPPDPDLEPLEGTADVPTDTTNYAIVVPFAIALGVGIGLIVNRILHGKSMGKELPDAVFVLARQHVAESPAVMRALGSPLTCKNSFRYTDDKTKKALVTNDFARFSFDVSGPKGTAVAQLQAVRNTDDSWQHTHLSVEVPGLHKIILSTDTAGNEFQQQNASRARRSPRKKNKRGSKRKNKK